MSWFGQWLGDLAGTLFPGAKALVEKAVDRVVDALIDAGREFLASWQKNSPAATQSPAAAARAQRSRAEDLAAAERELGEKLKRDGRRASADADRVEELHAAREQLREEVNETNAVQAAQELTSSKGLVEKPATSDELAYQVGLLSTKQCPTCKGVMTLRSDSNHVTIGQKFKWRCTAVKALHCPDVWVKADELKSKTTVREENPDLDLGPVAQRAWRDSAVLAKTQARVRSHLGDEDLAMTCPHHLLPMKLLPVANAKGLLLDTYQYTCLGVSADGRACSHTIPLASFGQVSAMLHRTEGRGIL